MREIKFRGVATEDVGETSVKQGQMLFGQIVFEGAVPFIVGPVVESCEEYIALETWCPVNPETVGQFTGLLDKNGKEIYEGDIITYKPLKKYCAQCEDQSELTTDFCPKCGAKGADKRERGDIRFEDAKFSVAHKWAELPDYEVLSWIGERFIQEVEVLGNIHENPELVKPE